MFIYFLLCRYCCCYHQNLTKVQREVFLLSSTMKSLNFQKIAKRKKITILKKLVVQTHRKRLVEQLIKMTC